MITAHRLSSSLQGHQGGWLVSLNVSVFGFFLGVANLLFGKYRYAYPGLDMKKGRKDFHQYSYVFGI